MAQSPAIAVAIHLSAQDIANSHFDPQHFVMRLSRHCTVLDCIELYWLISKTVSKATNRRKGKSGLFCFALCRWEKEFHVGVTCIPIASLYSTWNFVPLNEAGPVRIEIQ